MIPDAMREAADLTPLRDLIKLLDQAAFVGSRPSLCSPIPASSPTNPGGTINGGRSTGLGAPAAREQPVLRHSGGHLGPPPLLSLERGTDRQRCRIFVSPRPAPWEYWTRGSGARLWRSGCRAEGSSLPFPREELIKLACGMIVDPCQHVGEPSLRVDVVETGGLDQRVHEGGTLATTS